MRFLALLVAGMLAFGSGANAAAPGPQEVVQQATDQVIQVIEEAKDYYDTDPDRYYRSIGEILDGVVDFYGFSRAVMGGYGSKKREASLKTDAEKEAFFAQIDRFSKVFKVGLVQTYGKGFLAFGGNKIEVRPAVFKDGDARSAQVTQLVYGSADEPHEVRYVLRQGEDGAWMLRNVIIGNINLGLIYRNQFRGAVKQHKGEISAVIDNWSVKAEEV